MRLVEVLDVAQQVARHGARLRAVGAGGHAGVEGGDADVAQAPLAAGGQAEALDAPGDGLLLELDLVAHEVDELGARAGFVGGGDDAQDHLGALGAADLAHGAREGLVADVLDGAVALAHADDEVALLKADVARVAGRGPAGHQLHHAHGAVVVAQGRADAAEGEVHLHAEVLEVHRGHVIGVRVVGVGDGREVALEDGLGIHLGEGVAQGAVALGQDGGDGLVEVLVARFVLLLGFLALGLGLGGLLGVELLGEGEGQVLVLEAGAPKGALGGLVGGALGLAAFPEITLVRGEVEGLGLLEDGLDEVAPRLEALADQLHEVVAEGEVAAGDHVVDALLLRLQAREVGLREQRAVVVERVHQVRPGDGREAVAEAFAGEVVEGQLAGDAAGDLGVDRLRGDGGDGGLDRRGGQQAEEGKDASVHVKVLP